MENTEKQIGNLSTPKKAKWITIRFILALCLFLLTLFIFLAIAEQIVIKQHNSFDEKISGEVHALVSPKITSFMELITFFGSANFLFPAYTLVIIFYLIRRKSRLALDITMIGLSSTGILFLFKDIFRRHRPLDPLVANVTGFSFPSGHSFSSFTFYGLLIYLVFKTDMSLFWKIIIAVFFFLFAAAIALSRVYLRVHFASDVIAGSCLSTVWMMIAIWILHKADRELAMPSLKKN